MAFTLILLGTDTLYAPETSIYYERGELLSFTGTLIPGTQSGDLVEPYHGYAIQIINGPDTMGYGVGDRIARAVLSILRQIQQGETKYNILAHSRGAVEAILVAHELKRIQELFSKESVSWDKITQSQDQAFVSRFSTSSLSNSMNSTAYFAMNNEPLKTSFTEIIQKIKTNTEQLTQFKNDLAQARLAIFNIDPVPGGNRTGLQIGWRDSRFYQVPDNVIEYTQYVYQYEYSRCFKPVVPYSVDKKKTQYKIFTLPGHHGTGSGNLYDQQRLAKNEESLGIGKTSHVQEVLLLRILQFLLRNGTVDFKSRQVCESEYKLNADLLDLVYDSEGNVITEQQILSAKSLQCYQKIHDNKMSYEYFKNTTYVSGKEMDYEAMVWSNASMEGRLIHYHQHSGANKVFLSKKLPEANELHVNTEHEYLTCQAFNEQIGIKQDMYLHEKLKCILDALNHSTENKDSILKFLEVNIQHIFQQYLENETILNHPDELKDALELLKQVQDDVILSKLKAGLMYALKQQQKILLSSPVLKEQSAYYNELDQFLTIIQQVRHSGIFSEQEMKGFKRLEQEQNPDNQKKESINKVALIAIISFALGFIVGMALILTGVLAPLGLGVWGAIIFSSILGGAAATISGVVSTAVLTQKCHSTVEPPEGNGSASKLAQLGGSNESPETCSSSQPDSFMTRLFKKPVSQKLPKSEMLNLTSS